MPNRRRRKLSTAMSAVAALAVASPCAYFLVYESTSGSKPPEHHEFKQAAVMTDLPGELVGALTQGLSSFGVNLPPIPALGGGGTGAGLGTGGLGTTGLTSPGLGTPGLTSPGLGTPGLGTPGLASPGLTSPGLTSPGLTPGVTAPGALTPGLTDSRHADDARRRAEPGADQPGRTHSGRSGRRHEVPIARQLDAGADGSYPILGDPSTLGGGSPAGRRRRGSGGLVNDVMQAANQLGAGQLVDLLKGVMMPAITQAQGGRRVPLVPAGCRRRSAGCGGYFAARPAGCGGALPGAAGALPGAAAALPSRRCLPSRTSGVLSPDGTAESPKLCGAVEQFLAKLRHGKFVSPHK